MTDLAAVKGRLGAGKLTSGSNRFPAVSQMSSSQSGVRSAFQTDRSEFWRSVGVGTVLLTDGVLRAGSSRLALRYDATQDDALWEVRWARRAAGGTEENAGADTATRLTLAEEWPTTESLGWGDAFGLPRV